MTTGAISRTRSLNIELAVSTELLVGIVAQALQGSLLEFIELMRRAVPERKVGDEAIGDILLLLADHLAQFQRQRRRDRNGAGTVS